MQNVELLRNLIKKLVFCEIAKKSQNMSDEPNIDKPYEKNLLDDETYESKSVYVPDDIKAQINKWAEDMGLRRRKRRK